MPHHLAGAVLGVMIALFSAVPLLAQEVPLSTGDVVEGELSERDEQRESGQFLRGYTLDVGTAESFAIRLTSQDFDTYLIALLPSGEHYENDDYLGSTSESRLYLRGEREPEWQVRVTSYGAGETGAYQLEVRAATPEDVVREEALARAEALNREVVTLYGEGRYGDAAILAREVLAIREDVLGPEHPDVATSLNNLAALYRSLRRYAEAEPLLERALAIREAALGPEHPDVATSINNLAGLYQATGRYAEAEPLYQRALTIDKAVLGPEHPAVATSLNNLAALYRSLRRYAEAEPLYQRALSIREAALGPDHPDVATSLNNLALQYQDMGRYAEAEPLLERALAIREAALGPDHPTVAASFNNLAKLYQDLGRHPEAEPLYERALAIKEAALGPEHPDLAFSLNNLAALYWAMGRYAEAEPLLERTLAIFENALGPHHPDVATSLNNLASLYESLGRYAKAEPLHQRALAIRKVALGPEHPEVAQSLNNLASLYESLGRYAEAEPLHQRALAIDKAVLGPDHPEVATDLNNLASLYKSQGRYAEAEPLYERALAIFEAALGADHPAVATSLNNLAGLQQAIGRDAEAEPLYRRALDIVEAALGPEHPQVAASLNNLAVLYWAMGQHAEAESLYLRAERIARLAGEPRLAWTVLGNLMDYYRDHETPLAPLAIYYGKQGINVLQAVREELEHADAVTRQSFLDTVEDYYRELAALLVAEGRLPEAQQVLAMLHEEEYHDFIRREAGRELFRADAGLTETEARWQGRHQDAAGALARLGEEARALERRREQGTLSEAEAERLRALRGELRAANAAFEQTLAELKAAFLALADDRERLAQERRRLEENLMGQVAALGEGVALIQTVSLPEQLVVLLTTDRIRQAYHVEVERAPLNQAVHELLGALRDPRHDPRPAGQALYTWLIAPLQADLAAAGIDHLMLSTDGALRYVPLAALYSGEAYLVTAYTLSRYSEVTAGRPPSTPESPDWRVAGLGVSVAHPPRFSALPAVPGELGAIAGETGVLPGAIHLDDAFTRDRFFEVVDDAYPVLHLASHFRFEPGTEEDSFLLLGDGSAFTLADFRLYLPLPHVDLLTLSACETAVGSGGRGTEVEGLAVTAQRAGASSVLATLWPVADETTALVMQRFYRLLATEGLGKAAALRQAQRELLEGTIVMADGNSQERGLRATQRGEGDFTPPAEAPFAHPYYWAPFILMGHWQ